MSDLSNEKVIEIAKTIATANSVSFSNVTAAPTVDSTGSEAIEIKFVLIPGLIRQNHGRTFGDHSLSGN